MLLVLSWGHRVDNACCRTALNMFWNVFQVLRNNHSTRSRSEHDPGARWCFRSMLKYLNRYPMTKSVAGNFEVTIKIPFFLLLNWIKWIELTERYINICCFWCDDQPKVSIMGLLHNQPSAILFPNLKVSLKLQVYRLLIEKMSVVFFGSVVCLTHGMSAWVQKSGSIYQKGGH